VHKTCLVTGGAGFIGVAISDGLAQRFDRVVAFDNLHPQVHSSRVRPEVLHPRVEFVCGDVTDSEAWASLLPDLRPTVVVHLAAETGTGQSLTEATRHAHVNVLGTAMMLDALTRLKISPKRIVLTSSRAVYGEGAWRSRANGSIYYPGQRSREQLAAAEWDFPGLTPLPVNAATTRPTPASVYGATKLTQEHIMSAWAHSLGSTIAVLRLQNVYGPGQSLTNPYTGIVPLFCRLAREGKSIPLYEDGRMLRDFVFIDDVADAILRVIDIADVPADPIDIGVGIAAPIIELAERLAAIYGAPPPHVCGDYRYGDVRHATCMIDDARTQLGWVPRHGLETGLEHIRDWIDHELGRYAR
jgi:dTDP-L-rhamnose 4-epimerase